MNATLTDIESSVMRVGSLSFGDAASLLARHGLTLHRVEDAQQLGMNDIARIKIRTAQPLAIDSYRKNRITGSVILVDEGTNETVAAGMIV